MAAATALKASLAGKKVLVMSTDPAHSLADAFDTEIGPDPKEMAPGLWAQEMDHTSMIEDNWAEIQGYMTTLFEWQGADTLAAEELAMLPGMDELFGLLMVRRHNQEDRYDALILDAAPTGETLKLLSLPRPHELVRREDLPHTAPRREAGQALREQGEIPAAAARGQRLRRGAEVLRGHRERRGDPDRPRKRVCAPGAQRREDGHRRGAPRLHLPQPLRLRRGRRGGQPAPARDRERPLLRPLARGAGAAHEDHRESFDPIPILTARLFDREMFGLEALGALAEDVFEDAEPLGVLFRGATHDIVKNGDGYDVVFHLPLAEKRNVDLSKKGAELLVKVGNYRRNILLPDALARLPAAGASFEEDH